MSKNKLPFILKLTNGKLHPLLVFFLVIVCMLALLTVVFLIDNIKLIWSNYLVTIEFTIAIAYVIFITRVIHNIHRKSFYELLALSDLSHSDRAVWENRFFTFRSPLVETIVAIALGVTHASLNGYSSIFTESVDLLYYKIWGALVIILIWIVVTHSNSLFIRNMNVLNRLSREAKIDLLNMEKLMPLTKSGVWSILGFMGIYTILFFKDVSSVDWLNPAILIIAPSVFYMIYTPLKGVRKRVIAEKERELEIIDAAIEGDHEALKNSRIGANLSNINVIDLISYKRTIQNTVEIPVNIPTASRFIFYLIIPLLTWIAASMVDKVIDYLLK